MGRKLSWVLLGRLLPGKLTYLRSGDLTDPHLREAGGLDGEQQTPLHARFGSSAVLDLYW